MYKEKLRELLKEVPEVKEQMEKLEFGCNFNTLMGDSIIFTYICENGEQITAYDEGGILKIHKRNFFEIIGLPLQERFIRMYCENKNINYSIHKDGFGIQYKGVIKIDNKKDLENQSETFYKELYEALLELNKGGEITKPSLHIN